MALTPSFQCVSFNTPLINPSLGGLIDPSAAQFTDNSTGSDGAIVSRQILIYNNQNALIVPAVAWPLATNPITVNPFGQDVAANVVVNWLSNTGAVLYTTSQILPFTGYGEQFYYNLLQTESSNQSILLDVNYQNYKATLLNYLDAAIRAITIGQNIGNSQAAIIKEQYLVTNSNQYY